MQTKADLIRENEEFKARLALSQKWMMRQVAEARFWIEKNRHKNLGRERFVTEFEDTLLEEINMVIDVHFHGTLEKAPRFTRERLRDAEIYWNTLQKHSSIDALSITLAYQKILDSFFEKITSIFLSIKNPTFHTFEKWLENDIKNVLEKHYTLSIGRWYQLLQLRRSGAPMTPILSYFFENIGEHFPGISDRLTADEVYLPLERLVNLEIFSHKRHEDKVSYSDAKTVREICTGNYHPDTPSLLLSLFRTL